MFSPTVRHGDIYARSEIWSNNNVKNKTNKKKNTVETSEHISAWALTRLLSIYRSHEWANLVKTLFLLD